MDGWQTLDDKLKLLGLKATMLNNYDQKGNVLGDKQTTPSDIATFMEELYKGLLLSPTSTNDFLNLLKNDQLNDWLPSGLPTGTVIAHKTGALYDLVHDAGIVYSPKGDYLVVLMTKGWNDPVNDAPPVFTGLSSQLWSFFTS
jgi:beta-lactamase class A